MNRGTGVPNKLTDVFQVPFLVNGNYGSILKSEEIDLLLFFAKKVNSDF